MGLLFDDGTARLLLGDVREQLRSLPDESVHCVVTSPPYWGLRAYDTEPQVWGGDPNCPHAWGDEVVDRSRATPGVAGSGLTVSGAEHQASSSRFEARSTFCSGCGAWRGELGLEPTPELYVQHMVDVFREVWRVLRKDGTLWVNMGDSYGMRAQGPDRTSGSSENGVGRGPRPGVSTTRIAPGLKSKDLVGMPWELALALRRDGWWLRRDIIWHKPNPMPERVDDRCTTSHEYLFHLAKSGAATYWTHRDGLGSRVAPPPDYRWLDALTDEETAEEPLGDWRTEMTPDGRPRWRRINLWLGQDYFYDATAIAEPVSGNAHPRYSGSAETVALKVSRGGAWDAGDGSGTRPKYNTSASAAINGLVAQRNKRSVWTIGTQANPEAHFATFPNELPRNCILAGTSAKGCCPQCGAPWERLTEERRGNASNAARAGTVIVGKGHPSTQVRKGHDVRNGPVVAVRTLAWAPTCEHDDEPTPCTVLDPFAGTGTTVAVAKQLDRRAIGIELSAEYAAMAVRRIRGGAQTWIEAVV